MRFRAALIAALLFAACGKAKNNDTDRTETALSSAPRVGAAEPVDEAGSASNAEKGTPTHRPDDPRLKLLNAEWSAYEDVEISHSAADLTAPEKEMLRHLLAAGRLIEELYMLQLHPDNLRRRDQLLASGTEIEKKIFFRNRMPWCADNENALCSAVADAGPKRVGFGFWPENFDEKKYEGLSREINAKELLSPFTVVRDKSPRGYNAIPFAGFDLFGPKLRKLQATLQAAAAVAPDASLKKFLLSRADAVASLSPFPYDDSDYDWIRLKGDWEVTAGPYETYESPFQTKAFFEMVIGREDKELTASLVRLKSDMKSMDAALSALVGETVYKPRALAPEISLRAVDVWGAFGDARQSRGAILAYHLPNRGKAVDEGLYKKVILVNHAAALEKVTRARAALILDPTQQSDLSFRDGITNTAFHELAHGFGAYHEMRITDFEGRLTTIKEALREYDSLLEELKADTMSLWLSQLQNDAKTLDDASLRRRYVSGVVHLLGLLQYPLDDTYMQMAAVLLGRLMDDGAVVFDAKTGRSTVVFDKMSPAVAALLKDTATIQLTGDFKGAAALIGKYCARTEGTISLVGHINSVRDAVIERFKSSQLKSLSLRYTVAGLE